MEGARKDCPSPRNEWEGHDEASSAGLLEKGEVAHPKAEPNVVISACIFVNAIVLDAMNALPTTVVQDVPTSLRTSAFVLVACLAAHPVHSDMVDYQRIVFGIAVFLVAIFGLHHAGPHVRLADGMYCGLAGWATVLLYTAQTNSKRYKSLDTFSRREGACTLAGALLLYSGARIVRAGFTHAREVVMFTISHDEFTTRGYAAADDIVVLALIFGGTMAVCSAGIVISNHELVQEFGSTSIAAVTAMCTVFVFTAAFVCQLAVYARVEDLPAIFGPNACAGSAADCAAAYRARRMFMSNASPNSLWATAVGMAVLSFPPSKRCRSRTDYFVPGNISSAAGIATFVATAGAVIAVMVFAESDLHFADIELILMYTSIPAAWFGSTSAAAALHVAGQSFYMAVRLGSAFGYDLNYFTHWSLAATLLLIIVFGLSSFVTLLLQKQDCHSPPCERVTSSAVIMATSIQFFLTLATLGMLSGYDGPLVTDERSWRQVGYEWTCASKSLTRTQHNLSFFFVAAVYASRYENHAPCIRIWERRLLWFLPPVVLGICWIATMLFNASGVPYDAATDQWNFVLGIGAAVVPWVVAGFLTC